MKDAKKSDWREEKLRVGRVEVVVGQADGFGMQSTKPRTGLVRRRREAEEVAEGTVLAAAEEFVVRVVLAASVLAGVVLVASVLAVSVLAASVLAASVFVALVLVAAEELAAAV